MTVVANAPPGGPGDKLWKMFEDTVMEKSGGSLFLSLLVHGQIGGDDLVQEGKEAFADSTLSAGGAESDD